MSQANIPAPADRVFYSASVNGFFHSSVHGERMLPDVVEITLAQHRELLDAQARGKIIAPGADGRPVAQDRPAPSAEQVRAAVAARCQAILADTAWSQAPDEAPELRAVWADYRSRIRAIAAAPTPDVIWPEPPCS